MPRRKTGRQNYLRMPPPAPYRPPRGRARRRAGRRLIHARRSGTEGRTPRTITKPPCATSPPAGAGAHNPPCGHRPPKGGPALLLGIAPGGGAEEGLPRQVFWRRTAKTHFRDASRRRPKASAKTACSPVRPASRPRDPLALLAPRHRSAAQHAALRAARTVNPSIKSLPSILRAPQAPAARVPRRSPSGRRRVPCVLCVPCVPSALNHTRRPISIAARLVLDTQSSQRFNRTVLETSPKFKTYEWNVSHAALASQLQTQAQDQLKLRSEKRNVILQARCNTQCNPL